MECQMCGGDAKELHVIPIRNGDSYVTKACTDCAEYIGALCHGKTKLVFEDESMACSVCVDELAGRIQDICRALLSELPTDETSANFTEWLCDVSNVLREPPVESFARAIATKALRYNVSVECVITKVWRERSAACILPSAAPL